MLKGAKKQQITHPESAAVGVSRCASEIVLAKKETFVVFGVVEIESKGHNTQVIKTVRDTVSQPLGQWAGLSRLSPLY